MIDLSLAVKIAQELALTIEEDMGYLEDLATFMDQLEKVSTQGVMSAEDRASFDDGMAEIELATGSIYENISDMGVTVEKILNGMEKLDKYFHPEEWADEDNDEDDDTDEDRVEELDGEKWDIVNSNPQPAKGIDDAKIDRESILEFYGVGRGRKR